MLVRYTKNESIAAMVNTMSYPLRLCKRQSTMMIGTNESAAKDVKNKMIND